MSRLIGDTPFTAAANLLWRWRRAAAASRELASLGPEMDVVAKDLGLTSRELRALAEKGTGAAKELTCVLDALGIDQHAVVRHDPLVLRDLQRVCTLCEHKKECNHDLDAGTIAQNYSGYCSNASTLQALKPDAGET
jgi:Family of unknown function (DUF6455)